VTGVTLQNRPTGIAISAVTESSMTLTIEGTFFNAAVPLSAFKFSVLNGVESGWQLGSSWPATGLSPNTGYSFSARARNRAAIATLDTPLVSSTTLAKIPTRINRNVASDIDAQGNDEHQEGSYYAASVARYARVTDVNAAAGEQKPRTYAVALASPLPRIEFPIGGRKVTLVPFAKSIAHPGQTGDFRIPQNVDFRPTNTFGRRAFVRLALEFF
jgi:hypothetical protein